MPGRTASLERMIREDVVAEEGTLELRPKVRNRYGKSIPDRRRSRKWEQVWCVQGGARWPVWLVQVSAGEDGHRKGSRGGQGHTSAGLCQA